MSAHTPTTWHVNAVDTKRGRITGDETSEGWDKLQVNGGVRTIATVYRPADARYLVTAVNAHADMLAALEAALTHWHGNPRNFEKEEPVWLSQARAAIAKAKGGAA